MLLDLYVAQSVGTRVSVTSASHASGSASTTALRYLKSLEQHALVIRTQDPSDRRRMQVTLSEAAITLLNRWFERTQPAKHG
ncbi:hypothetical protein ASG37_15705 [Sphingomonas sp. Leaf407]|uniref:hypothetical protein n=1 Tax=unclassified Sphingomonas TaxID=196159 RepID=UPI0007009F8B|nr:MULTISPECIES: hypothetical protein [unclassified Sphingomonas]KQN34766.1 hypothetical protein ASE97_14960 [Sphingomonas sp. Leaf42]KQT25319.1 hypothetical protein ASG37_15705 [Sphingomonas sp. Leaf407]